MNNDRQIESASPVDPGASHPQADPRGDLDDPLLEEQTSRKEPRWRHGRALAVGLVSATAAIGILELLRVPAGARNAFELMGLDPDRAQLVVALMVGALAAAAAALVSGWRVPALIAGSAASAVTFGRTFIHETQAAVASHGAEGVFDPAGWLATVGTLALVMVAIAWAVAAIALSLRQSLAVAASHLRRSIKERRLRDAGWLRAVAWMVTLLLVADGFGRLADMLNYTPDLQMRAGAALPLGLGDPGSASPSPLKPGQTPAPTDPSLAPDTTFAPGIQPLVAGPLPGSLVTAGTWSPLRPWTAWQLAGRGTVEGLPQPAPWVGANGVQVRLDIYRPPGYEAGTRRYPVTYALPWSLDAWNRSAGVIAQLDTLISSGAIPAQIVVFAEESTGPFPASQCADSANGGVWWERYLIQQIVPMIDSSFRTIAQPAARSLLGESMGGFCAAALLARHPDVFGSAASISGYFDAAPRSNQTAPAGRVFGDNAALEATWSPSILVRDMPPKIRQQLFFVIVAKPTNRFYGYYYRSFGSELAHLGVPCALLPDDLGHSWIEARMVFGPVLELLAGHMSATGVFAGQPGSLPGSQH
jgi:hypothetical protein